MTRTTRRIAGIDIGGTFTDLLLYEVTAAGERVHVAKVPTDTANRGGGVLSALARRTRIPSCASTLDVSSAAPSLTGASPGELA